MAKTGVGSVERVVSAAQILLSVVAKGDDSTSALADYQREISQLREIYQATLALEEKAPDEMKMESIEITEEEKKERERLLTQIRIRNQVIEVLIGRTREMLVSLQQLQSLTNPSSSTSKPK
jgi:hypothetical protein